MDQIVAFWIIVAAILSFPVTYAFIRVRAEIRKPESEEDIIA